jgi:hypothetical protein
MTKTLSCKAGEWEYQNLTWDLPAFGTEGYIMESSLNGTALSIENGLIGLGTPVVLKELDGSTGQKWIINEGVHRNGFFSIENGPSELLITLNNWKNLTIATIEGKSINN